MKTPRAVPDERVPGEGESSLAFADVVRLVRAKIRTIAIAAVVSGGLAAAYALTRPITYQAEATFREKGSLSPSPEGSGVLSAVLFGVSNGSSNQGLVALFKSRQLMKPVIEQLGLQATVSERGPSLGPLGLIWDNLRIELAYAGGRSRPLAPRASSPLIAYDVRYGGEVPLGLSITFEGPSEYRVENAQGQRMGVGQLDVPFDAGDVAFTLRKCEPMDFAKRSYRISFTPLPALARSLATKIKIKPAEEREKVLRILFDYHDRVVASEFVNGLMASYRDFASEDNHRFAETQLDYLRARQQASLQELQTFMSQHAAALSEDLAISGILDTEKELKGLLAMRQKCCHELKVSELELRRLEAVDLSEPDDFRTLSTASNLPQMVQGAIAELNAWRAKRDTLEVALHDASVRRGDSAQDTLSEHLANLQGVRCRSDQARECLEALEAGHELPEVDPEHLGYLWKKRLVALQDRIEQAQTEAQRASLQKESKGVQDSLKGYLHHQLHASQVHERMIQERVAHQYSPDPELQGIDLHSAEGIFLALTQRRNEVEVAERQNYFVLQQLQDPSFEISSLADALPDPVSAAIIEEASKLLLSLQDSHNRSEREQTRLREELSRQREFLAAHLQQSNQLLNLRKEFLNEKTYALQKVLHDLIQQQVSVAEKHISDYLLARIDSLRIEQELIEQTQAELREQMALLPARWVSEQMIAQRLKLNKALVEEVARLIESKNIAHNLETIQSGPIDRATAPVLPKRPGLLWYSLLGMVFGAALVTGGVIVNGIRKGLEASPENLWLDKQSVAGFLDGSDTMLLETLRRLSAQLYRNSRDVLFLMLGRGPDYSRELAKLLAKGGAKVLRVSLAFDGQDKPSELPGLLQVLEGSVALPTIRSVGAYDEISSGGASLYRNELLRGPRFQAILESLCARYDAVLLVAPTLPDSAEAENIVERFDRIAVTLERERLQDIASLLHPPSAAQVAFLFAASPKPVQLSPSIQEAQTVAMSHLQRLRVLIQDRLQVWFDRLK